MVYAVKIESEINLNNRLRVHLRKLGINRENND